MNSTFENTFPASVVTVGHIYNMQIISHFVLASKCVLSSVLGSSCNHGPTHNAALKAGVVSQQGHTFTLIWLLGYCEFMLPAGLKQTA